MARFTSGSLTAKAALVGALLLGVAGLSAYAATRPSHYTVTRSRVVSGTPTEVAPFLTDLRQWIRWNPWDAMEPSSVKEYSDPASGVGAWYTWRGDQTGAGRMEITAISSTRVDYAMHFMEPMDDRAVVYMTMTPEGDARTNVSWTIEGELGFPGKVMDVLMGMDAMLGADFERGLAKLDELLQAQ